MTCQLVEGEVMLELVVTGDVKDMNFLQMAGWDSLSSEQHAWV